MQIAYRTVRSRRKTMALVLLPDGTLEVRCPLRMADSQVRTFVESKRSWIEKQLSRQLPAQPVFTERDLSLLTEQVRKTVSERLAYFAPLVGVSYGRVSIRRQKTRWGSCSGKGNLNFNCLLALTPAEVQDYVVVHELCHRKEMNHSPRFWTEVARVLPDYSLRRKWLRENGRSLIARLPK